MPKRKNKFNKKVFSILVEKAKGERTVRRFASESGISYLQLRKLLMCEQENPPGMKLIKKLAENSETNIELEDFMFAAGESVQSKENVPTLTPKIKLLIENYSALTSKQQRTVDDFINFLIKYRG